MCGVTGWLNSRPSIGSQWDAQVVLDRMRASMRHRGPDDFGSWRGETGQVALANRRLSIVDLSEQARQPMVSETEEVVLSYNGEIYNHLELRAQLEGLGYRFRSRCDSETALYAFQEWGIDCVRRFKVQFAFAAWDGPETLSMSTEDAHATRARRRAATPVESLPPTSLRPVIVPPLASSAGRGCEPRLFDDGRPEARHLLLRTDFEHPSHHRGGAAFVEGPQ